MNNFMVRQVFAEACAVSTNSLNSPRMYHNPFYRAGTLYLF